jgi:betaine reductase
MTFRVVHYINQFYAGMGGEDTAHVEPSIRKEATGPGLQLGNLLKGEAEIVGTVVCGDSYYGENMEKAREKCLEMISSFKPDILIAGPGFNAGRYGVACGDICAAAAEKFGIPTLTALYSENPGVEMYRSKTFIIETGDSARAMKNALDAMASLSLKLLRKELLGSAKAEGYISRGIRKSFFHEKTGAERAVDMLLKKIRGEAFETELEMPVFKKIPPAAPVRDLSKATIALCTSGGIVPFGNPDHIRVSSAESFGKYDISGLADATPEMTGFVSAGNVNEMIEVPPMDRIIGFPKSIAFLSGGASDSLREDGSMYVELQSIIGSTNELGFSKLGCEWI